MKHIKIGALLVALCMLTSMLAACSDNTSEAGNGYEYINTDDDIADEDAIADGEASAEGDASTDGDAYEDDGDGGSSSTFSLDNVAITDEFARQIYTTMQANDFDSYRPITTDQWKTLSDEEKQLTYKAFYAMLVDLGFDVDVPEDAWIKAMDENADFYTDYYIWSFAFENLGLSGGEERLISIYRYIGDVEEGKYTALHPDIFAAADDITIEYYQGDYLLCVGGEHTIAQLTKKWTTSEDFFIHTGSIIPLKSDEALDDEYISYTIGGENELYNVADFGSTDLLPVLRAVGAINETGSMICEQIQISARSGRDANKLFVLVEHADKKITFAVLNYNETDGGYVWDNQLYAISERCCFDDEGYFCYIDEYGILQLISSAQ